MTLIEIMIASAITGGLAIGAYQMMAKYQKFMAYKNVTQNGQSEINDLGVVLKKDWDYRVRQTVGIPANYGYELQKLDGTPCTAAVCPQIAIRLNRRINAALTVDRVTISNTCVDTTKTPSLVDIHAVDFTPVMDVSCSVCGVGYIPQVTIKGVDNSTNATLLSAENRVFPGNSKNLKTMLIGNTLGMQACFTQANADPLATTIRSFHLDMDLKLQGVARKIRKIEKNQFYPFSNFANIQLEQ